MIGSVSKVGSTDSSKFQYIKRQDICGLGPKQDAKKTQDNLAFTNEDQVLEDKLYLKFTIKDMAENGIEIEFLNVKDEPTGKVVFYHQSEFNTDGEILLAGSGNSVYIKDIRIKRKEKIQMHDVDVRSYD